MLASIADGGLNLVEAERHIYTPCYCEENIYKLCASKLRLGATEGSLHVVFISNPEQKVYLCKQRVGHGENGLIVWDYHVILLERKSENNTMVWDFDSTLPFPCPLREYAAEALRPTLPWPTNRMYRVIEGQAFVEHFASDRSHMVLPDGTWQAPPPAYPCIISAGGETMNLLDYINMVPNQNEPRGLGEIYAEDEFLDMFSSVFLTQATSQSPCFNVCSTEQIQ